MCQHGVSIAKRSVQAGGVESAMTPDQRVAHGTFQTSAMVPNN